MLKLPEIIEYLSKAYNQGKKDMIMEIYEEIIRLHKTEEQEELNETELDRSYNRGRDCTFENILELLENFDDEYT